MHARAGLSITVLDPSGKQTPARISITGDDGRAYAPDNTWMQADDSFVRSERPFEAHYSISTGHSELLVPIGRIRIEVMKGFEYQFERQDLTMLPGDHHVTWHANNVPSGAYYYRLEMGGSSLVRKLVLVR